MEKIITCSIIKQKVIISIDNKKGNIIEKIKIPVRKKIYLGIFLKSWRKNIKKNPCPRYKFAGWIKKIMSINNSADEIEYIRKKKK